MSYLFIDTCAGAGVALVNSEKPSDVLVKVNPDGKAQVEALPRLPGCGLAWSRLGP